MHSWAKTLAIDLDAYVDTIGMFYLHGINGVIFSEENPLPFFGSWRNQAVKQWPSIK